MILKVFMHRDDLHRYICNIFDRYYINADWNLCDIEYDKGDSLQIKSFGIIIVSCTYFDYFEERIPLDMMLFTIETYLRKEKWGYTRVGEYTYSVYLRENPPHRGRECRFVLNTSLEAIINSDTYQTITQL